MQESIFCWAQGKGRVPHEGGWWQTFLLQICYQLNTGKETKKKSSWKLPPVKNNAWICRFCACPGPPARATSCAWVRTPTPSFTRIFITTTPLISIYISNFIQPNSFSHSHSSNQITSFTSLPSFFHFSNCDFPRQLHCPVSLRPIFNVQGLLCRPHMNYQKCSNKHSLLGVVLGSWWGATLS